MNVNMCRGCAKVFQDKYLVSLRKISHKVLISEYLETCSSVEDLKSYIPSKYLKLGRYDTIEALYLVDRTVAKSIVHHILPNINHKNEIISETSPGLGLITAELLENNIPKVRLYESCTEFLSALKIFAKANHEKIELFKRDLFQLSKYHYMDKIDNQSRVKRLLRDVPKKKWDDGPCITIIGAMPKNTFMHYLVKSLALQTDIVSYGRLQIFAVMRPFEYLKMKALPKDNLHTYQWWSVLFQLLFDFELLEKYPRKAFVPWESRIKATSKTHYAKLVDLDSLYLVRINFKRNLPVSSNEMLQFLFFIKQFFGKGTQPAIPNIEKIVPNCGIQLIVPSMKHDHYYDNLSTFTNMGDMKPLEIFSLYKEVVNHPNYDASTVASIMQTELVKTETVEDDLIHTQEVLEELEEKI